MDEQARSQIGRLVTDIAIDLFVVCVQLDPGNVSYVQKLIDSLQKKHGNKDKIGPMTLFKERGAQRLSRKPSRTAGGKKPSQMAWLFYKSTRGMSRF